MPRTSLKANVAKKPAATEAAKVAKKLVVDPGPPHTEEEYYETVSYNLPIDLIELVRDVADARYKAAQAAKRKAKRTGEPAPEARRSASAVVREALDAYRMTLEAELGKA